MARVVLNPRPFPNQNIARKDGLVGFGLTRKHFEEWENFIADNQASVVKVHQGIDLLAMGMVYVIKGSVQKYAMGPISPTQRSVPALANRIPVQRITGRLFAGWTQRRISNGRWLLFSDEREAYLIETGMFQRARRPILKMALLDMLRFLQTTRTGERFLDHVLAPRRNSKGQFQSFNTRSMPTRLRNTAIDLPNRGAKNPNVAGPKGRLPG